MCGGEPVVHLYRLLLTDRFAALGLVMVSFGASLMVGVFLAWPA